MGKKLSMQMNKKTMKNRLFSAFLALAMVFNFLPFGSITAYADSTTCPDCHNGQVCWTGKFMGEDCSSEWVGDECEGHGDVLCDCTTCGGTGYVSTHTHSFAEAWTTDATNHWHACTADGNSTDCLSESGAAKAAHSGGTATCQAKAVCSTCNQEYGELATHSWGTWNAATGTRSCTTAGCPQTDTCTHNGATTGTCSTCGKMFYSNTYTLTVPATAEAAGAGYNSVGNVIVKGDIANSKKIVVTATGSNSNKFKSTTTSTEIGYSIVTGDADSNTVIPESGINFSSEDVNSESGKTVSAGLLVNASDYTNADDGDYTTTITWKAALSSAN